MIEEKQDRHIAPGELLEYFESILPAERENVIEEHLAECDACTEAAREARVFEGLWQWTADEHAACFGRELLDRALQSAEATAPPGLLQRLRRWRQHGLGLAEAGVRIVLERSRVAAKSFDNWSRPASPWRFEVVGQPIPVRGTAEASEASVLLKADTAAGNPTTRIAIHAGSSGEVVVRVDGFTPARRLPLMILINPLTEPPSVHAAEVEAAPGLDYGVARFESLAEGEYLLLFSPLHDADQT